MRSSFVHRCLLFTCLTAAFATPNSTGAQETRPNILFVFTDDHAYQSISAYGSRLNTTPHMDRLSAEGLRFDNCYVTNSICGPMRAVILTGKYSHLNGFMVNGNRFDSEQQTFPKLLQKAGYETAIIGKWHLGTAPTGFDYSEVLRGQGPYYNPPMFRNGERVEHVGYTTDIITDRALAWLAKERDSAKPFLLMYQHKAPHRPWEPGPRYLKVFDDVTLPEPATLFEDYTGRGRAIQQQDMTIAESMTERDLKLIPPPNLNETQLQTWNAAYGPKNAAFHAAKLEGRELVRWKYQRYVKDYLRCVASVDDNLGRVLAYLDDSGLAASTMVVYCSDQGFYLGEHGWFDKRWMYEETLRTPLLVRWPGVVQPGSFNNDIVSPLDFGATFLDIAGVTVPSDMQGRSLVPLLRGTTPDDWRKTFYYHYYEYPGWHYVRRHYGLTDSRFKLIHFYEPSVNEWELYDLHFDGNELNNLAGQVAYAKVEERLRNELTRLRRELAVPEEDPASTRVKGLPPRVRRPSDESGGQAHEPRFRSLFDGGSLSGWHKENGAKFSVRNGLMFVNQGTGWLRSEREYGDFIFKLDFRFLEVRANSGIFVRTARTSKSDENGWPDNGYQVQCMDTLSGAYPVGSMIPYGAPPFESESNNDALRSVYRPTGEWNSYEITCRGEELTVRVNGTLVTRATSIKRARGHLGIQGEHGRVEFRDLRIRELRE